ncbi:MAG TPA: FlgD immunoglobulin-like domain containing protein [Candidatus Krumholzibacteria bacterium]
MRRFVRIAAVILALLLLGGAVASNAATIVIQNNDGAGEGFNDPTAKVPVGGNPGTTLGAQRLNAFTYAASLWAARLSSPVTIVVDAQMNPLTCNAGSAVLGSAGTTTVHRNFSGNLVAGAYYCQALANSLAGTDLAPGTADINAQFNSSLNGSAGCLGGKKWYYGYDSNPPAGDIDFVSVVVHEIGHGLGFQTFCDLATGVKFNGFNDVYMLKLDQLGATPSNFASMTNAQRVAAAISDPSLRWTGANVTAFAPTIPIAGGLSGPYVRVYAPNPLQQGSSVSHFSTAVAPNEIMEPSYTGPNHNINLTLELMKDIGWSVIPNCTPGTTTVNDTDTLTVARGATTWSIKIKVQNTGSFDANSVSASIISGPAWLGISDPNGSYPDLAPGASSFNSDTYVLDLTNYPGGSFQVSLQVYFSDDCNAPHNQTVTVNLAPPVPTPVTPHATYVNRLEANVPNPFNPSTTIHYELAQSGRATLGVYDVSGRLVRTLVDREHNVGSYETRWDGRDDRGAAVASGVYFYRIESGRFTQTRRMVLLK